MKFANFLIDGGIEGGNFGYSPGQQLIVVLQRSFGFFQFG